MYDHKLVEKEMAEFLEKNKVYEKAKKKNAHGEPYYFCDGPPYATGHIHPGTAWNKSLKDAMCRYWRMRGFNVRAQPGFDTHGLPIEVKVEQELGIRKKKEIEERGMDKFVEKCKAFADKYIEIMGGQFKSIGVWMDWENPYITYHDDYIESSWKTLKMAHEKKLMHQGVYVLPYCYRCETTMANYELEYGEETDPSIYVKFRVKGKDEYLIIWTTTPWTLVANMAVMAHPKFSYVKAKVDDEVWIVAKERLDALLGFAGKSATVLEEISGKKLEGTGYEHPFQDLIEKKAEREVVLSDEYVSLEDGTGLVHCAPGHGQEDFVVGKRFGIEIFSPVDGAGLYTREAGKYAGKNVRETSPEIISMLKERGMLIHEERIKHRYPHCWRCKTPLIFRATDQWFITISKLKERMMAEIETTEWYPAFAKDRFMEFASQAPDWCISRQRYWGIPLPIWRCGKCAEIKVIGSRDELPDKGKDLKDLHRPNIDAVELKCGCGGTMRRVADVLDVWFDSGNAVWASMDGKDAKAFGERAELILEGQDQIRGWFYSLLGSGLLRYDRIPYKRLMMHGFFVDEKGEKMSKSVGNFVPIEEILEKYGADSFRLWGMGNTIWEELRFNWNELKEAHSDLDILVNMGVFLERFYPKTRIENAELYVEDKWLLSRMNSTLKEYHKAFENYQPNLGIRALRRFLVEDLSRFYMKIAKDRINKGENPEGALYAIYTSVFTALGMFAPVSPFIGEQTYQRFFRKYKEAESISLVEL
ncbi:MAG: isoleucine--tRNA ligase, partial [Candidatus ainarchaeum sp.]|nr:isoleucine--tRNA ligase [Candidatus ainarchaeum sp.]